MIERVLANLCQQYRFWVLAVWLGGCLYLWGSAVCQAHEPGDFAFSATVANGDAMSRELVSGRVGGLIEEFKYFAIVVVLLLCGCGLPLPEEVPILTSAVLSQTGVLDPWWALAALMFGVILGDGAMFWLGRHWGQHVLEHRFAARMLSLDRRLKIEGYFQRYGAWIIFAGRFMPGLRAPLFLSAGTMQVSVWTFLGMDGLAALLSVPTSFWLAYYFTDQLEGMLQAKDQVQLWALVGVLLIGGIGVMIKLAWKRRQRSANGLVGQTTAESNAVESQHPHEH